MDALFTLLAQQSQDDRASNPLLGFLPIILLVAVFYLFMIRPQRTRMRQHQELISSLRLGDEVETISGIFGTIRAMDDESFMIEVAPGTTIRMARGAVRRKVYQPEEEESSGPAT